MLAHGYTCKSSISVLVDCEYPSRNGSVKIGRWKLPSSATPAMKSLQMLM